MQDIANRSMTECEAERKQDKTKQEANGGCGGVCVENLSVAALKTLERKMVDDGFMKNGEELRQICERDSKSLMELGVSARAIAARLRWILSRAIQTGERCSPQDGIVAMTVHTIVPTKPGWCLFQTSEAFVDGYYVRFGSWGGAQQCPFREHPAGIHLPEYEGFEYGCRDFILRDLATGQEMLVADLLPHLIAEHSFFESPTSLYRIDPVNAVAFLRLRDLSDRHFATSSFPPLRPLSGPSSSTTLTSSSSSCDIEAEWAEVQTWELLLAPTHPETMMKLTGSDIYAYKPLGKLDIGLGDLFAALSPDERYLAVFSPSRTLLQRQDQKSCTVQLLLDARMTADDRFGPCQARKSLMIGGRRLQLEPHLFGFFSHLYRKGKRTETVHTGGKANVDHILPCRHTETDDHSSVTPFLTTNDLHSPAERWVFGGTGVFIPKKAMD